MTPERPSTLYHYTSAKGALGIIRSGEVWASMIHYLNDASEFALALRLAEELIEEGDELPERTRQTVDDFIRAVRSVAVFVFSLSAKKDLLSQWRSYAPGGGYALGFSREFLEVVEAEENAILAPCIYEDCAQREQMRPVIQSLVKTAIGLHEDASGIDLYHAAGFEFTRAAALIKDRSFEAEEEWRIIFGPGVESTKTLARVSGTLMVPYYPCPIKRGGRYPIAEIVVGPGQDPDRARRSLHWVTASILDWPVQVTPSTSTLRLSL